MSASNHHKQPSHAGSGEPSTTTAPPSYYDRFKNKLIFLDGSNKNDKSESISAYSSMFSFTMPFGTRSTDHISAATGTTTANEPQRISNHHRSTLPNNSNNHDLLLTKVVKGLSFGLIGSDDKQSSKNNTNNTTAKQQLQQTLPRERRWKPLPADFVRNMSDKQCESSLNMLQNYVEQIQVRNVDSLNLLREALSAYEAMRDNLVDYLKDKPQKKYDVFGSVTSKLDAFMESVAKATAPPPPPLPPPATTTPPKPSPSPREPTERATTTATIDRETSVHKAVEDVVDLFQDFLDITDLERRLLVVRTVAIAVGNSGNAAIFSFHEKLLGLLRFITSINLTPQKLSGPESFLSRDLHSLALKQFRNHIVDLRLCFVPSEKDAKRGEVKGPQVLEEMLTSLKLWLAVYKKLLGEDQDYESYIRQWLRDYAQKAYAMYMEKLKIELIESDEDLSNVEIDKKNALSVLSYQITKVCERILEDADQLSGLFAETFASACVDFDDVIYAEYANMLTNDLNRFSSSCRHAQDSSQVTLSLLHVLCPTVKKTFIQLAQNSHSVEVFSLVSEDFLTTIRNAIHGSVLQVEKWAERAYSMDKWEPISEELLHTSSCADILRIFDQSLQVAKGLERVLQAGENSYGNNNNNNNKNNKNNDSASNGINNSGDGDDNDNDTTTTPESAGVGVLSYFLETAAPVLSKYVFLYREQCLAELEKEAAIAFGHKDTSSSGSTNNNNNNLSITTTTTTTTSKKRRDSIPIISSTGRAIAAGVDASVNMFKTATSTAITIITPSIILPPVTNKLNIESPSVKKACLCLNNLYFFRQQLDEVISADDFNSSGSSTSFTTASMDALFSSVAKSYEACTDRFAKLLFQSSEQELAAIFKFVSSRANSSKLSLTWLKHTAATVTSSAASRVRSILKQPTAHGVQNEDEQKLLMLIDALIQSLDHSFRALSSESINLYEDNLHTILRLIFTKIIKHLEERFISKKNTNEEAEYKHVILICLQELRELFHADGSGLRASFLDKTTEAITTLITLGGGPTTTTSSSKHKK